MGRSDILELAENARRAVAAQPAGHLINLGDGFALEVHFQSSLPPPDVLSQLARIGGRCDTVYTGEAVERMIAHAANCAASQERAAIVAWLRSEIGSVPTLPALWREQVADAIERGDHLLTTPEDTGL